jgi:hypothetical protein
LLRKSIELWWFDSSAKAIKDGYRGWTRLLFKASSVNSINIDKIGIGDLAATSDGVHIMVCTGRGEWMDADPGIGKVISVKVPVEGNYWFDRPVNIVRWKQLE